MVISVKETTVFAVFHPDAHDLYNTCSDLKKVAWELWDPKRRLGAEVGLPNIFPSCVHFSHFTLMLLGQSRSTFPSFRTYAL